MLHPPRVRTDSRGHGQDHARPRTARAGAVMLTVRPLYCPETGVLSTAQAPLMRGRRHAAAHHFQHVPASTAQSLLPAKGRRGARVTAVISSPFLVIFAVIAAGPGLRRGRVICSGVLAVAAVTAAGLS